MAARTARENVAFQLAVAEDSACDSWEERYSLRLAHTWAALAIADETERTRNVVVLARGAQHLRTYDV